MCDYPPKNKNVDNKVGGTSKSSGSDQDGFFSQDQTVAPSCTDTELDTETAVLAAVI